MHGTKRRRSVSGAAVGRNAIPAYADNIRFHSKKERDRYLYLKILLRAGRIKDLVLQPRFPLNISGKPLYLFPRVKGARAVCYTGDFSYYEKTGDDWVFVVEDTKGAWTDYGRLKMALVELVYGITVRVI